MYEYYDPTPPPRRNRSRAVKIALVGAGVAAGAVVATAIGANASTGSTNSPAAAVAAPTSTSTAAPAAPGRDGDHRGPGGGGPRGDEKALSAAITAKLKAAALKAVPGGTVERVETDSGDATYEAHMTKADGTKVTVKFNKDLSVKGVETGMGK